MSEETKFFICRNAYCEGGTTGGPINQYKPAKDPVIHCQHCDQVYYVAEDGKFFSWFENLTFNSFKEFQDFQDQYSANYLGIDTLKICKLSDKDNFHSPLSFQNCVITNVIIEDLELQSSFSPIFFDSCNINNLNINNCNIKEKSTAELLGSFFGISLVRTKIKESFKIANSDSSLCIVECNIPVSTNITNSKIDKLILLKNAPEVDLQLDKKSCINPNAENAEAPQLSGELMADQNTHPVSVNIIEELVIDDKPGIRIISDKEIKNLVIPDRSTVKARLIFNNCIIHELKNKALCFERDVVFRSSIFHGDFKLRDSRFEGSLIMEACEFTDDFSLDELKIDKNLYLAYCIFNSNTHLSHIQIGRYLNLKFSHCTHMLNLFRVETARDLFVTNTLIGKYFLINLCKIGGNIKLSKNTLSDLEILDTEISISLEMYHNELEQDGGLFIANCSMNYGLMFFNTAVAGVVSFISCRTKNILISDSFFKKNVDFSQLSYTDSLRIKNCLISDTFSLDNLRGNDSIVNKNIISGDITIDKCKLNDFKLEENQIRDIKIDKCKLNDFKLEENQIRDTFINECSLNDFSLYLNQLEVFRLENSELDDLDIYRNSVYGMKLYGGTYNKIRIYSSSVSFS